MKKRFLALGMAAVMVVGGGIMAFADEEATSARDNGHADIVFELNGDNFIREPIEPDFPPDDDDRTPPGGWHPGLRTMDLHFGTRNIMDLNRNLVLSTLDVEGVNALFANPPDNLRVMGVTFQHLALNQPFGIQVHRTDFDNGLESVVGVDFSLVPFGDAIRLNGPGIATLSTQVISDAPATVINMTNWGNQIAGFSGELTNVGQDQVSALTARATLFWTFVPAQTSVE